MYGGGQADALAKAARRSLGAGGPRLSLRGARDNSAGHFRLHVSEAGPIIASVGGHRVGGCCGERRQRWASST